MWQWRSDHPSSRSSSFICEVKRLTASASPVPRSQRHQPLPFFPSGENTHSCTRSLSLVPHRSCHFLLLSIRHSPSGQIRAAESHERCYSSVSQSRWSTTEACRTRCFPLWTKSVRNVIKRIPESFWCSNQIKVSWKYILRVSDACAYESGPFSENTLRLKLAHNLTPYKSPTFLL